MYIDYTKIVDNIWLNSTSIKFKLLSILRFPKTRKAVARCLQSLVRKSLLWL